MPLVKPIISKMGKNARPDQGLVPRQYSTDDSPGCIWDIEYLFKEATYLATPDKQTQFSHRKVELKGYSQALNAHQLELENLDCLEQRLMQHEDNPTLY